MTTFADMVFSLGSIPTFGPGGALTQTFTGNYWWVNETTGNDGNPGNSPSQAFKTLTQAQLSAVANNNDVVFLVGTVHVTATVAWAKNWVHLIGVSAPGNNPRSRISVTGTTAFTPLVNVTAQGCIFANLSTFHGFADASTQICWTDAGGRNYYAGVQFLGMGDAVAAAQAGSRSLLISGNTGENIFDSCTIGLDTVVRATGTNASLELTGHSPRNRFDDCVFRADVSNAADLHVLVGSGGIDRSLVFKRCTFINTINSGGTAHDRGLYRERLGWWLGAASGMRERRCDGLRDNRPDLRSGFSADRQYLRAGGRGHLASQNESDLLQVHPRSSGIERSCDCSDPAYGWELDAEWIAC